MLTPHIKDPERNNELVRKAAQPESFGRTSIPKMQETIVLGNEESTKLLEEAAQAKAAIREARNVFTEKRESLQVAKSNLADAVAKDAKPKAIESLESKRDEALEATIKAEATLNGLIDA